VRGRFAHADEGADVDDNLRRLVVYDTQPDPPMREAWTISDALVAALAREVAATGARFMVVAIPERGQILDAEWARLEGGIPAGRRARYERRHPDEMLDAIGTSHGIPVLSLTPAFRGDPHADALLLQGFHWSEQGNALAAQTVYQYLVARELVARHP